MSEVKDESAVPEERALLPRAGKRAYEAPRIQESGGFETMVLMCTRQRNGTPRVPSGCEGMLRS